MALSKMTELMRAGEYEEAWQVFASLEDADDEALQCQALNVCAKAVWWSRGQQLFSQMKPEFKSVNAYSTMIDLCARSKQAYMAEEVFAEMSQNGVEPNLVTYITLLKAFAMTNQADKALATLEALPRRILDNASRRSQHLLYQVVMAAFARQGNYEKAREVFMKMTYAGLVPAAGHYNSLMTACVDRADTTTAQTVMDMMKQAGIAPSVSHYTALISCYRNNLERCQEIFREMEEAGLKPTVHTYVELLAAHLRAGDADGARELLETVTELQGSRAPRKMEFLLDKLRTLESHRIY